MHIASGSIVGGKYRLESPLSRGGMGSVWVARHVHLGSSVAVKFMDQALAESPVFVTRFEREARSAARLESPHVVRVMDYGIDRGIPYLVMELLRGESLGKRLKRAGPLSLPEAVSLLGQVGKALRRAHEAGLVHRDLKPSNLFLAQTDDDEEVVKVLDFGIVKETGGQSGGEVTLPGEVVGSPHYMSPEQVRGGKDVDHRSDLWSLGVILFRALTGELPFNGDHIAVVITKILMDPVPRATEIAPHLPPALDRFFARAFERDQEQRFQSVREMLEALQRVAEMPARAASIVEAEIKPASPRFIPPPSPPPIPGVMVPPVILSADGSGATPAPGTLTSASLVTLDVRQQQAPARRTSARASVMVTLGAGATLAIVGVGVALALRGGSGPTEGDDGANVVLAATRGPAIAPPSAAVSAPVEMPAPPASAAAAEPEPELSEEPEKKEPEKKEPEKKKGAPAEGSGAARTKPRPPATTPSSAPRSPSGMDTTRLPERPAGPPRSPASESPREAPGDQQHKGKWW